MDCRFCSIEPATGFPVWTRYGVADLCCECAERFAIKKQRRPGNARPTPVFVLFPNEASGPARPPVSQTH